jgi:hypothetical protein
MELAKLNLYSYVAFGFAVQTHNSKAYVPLID